MAFMAVIKSTISADGLVVSIDMTNFGLLDGTGKVVLIMSSKVLYIWPPQLLQCLIELVIVDIPSLFRN